MPKRSKSTLAASNAASIAVAVGAPVSPNVSPGKENRHTTKSTPDTVKRAPKRARDAQRDRPRSSWHAALLPRQTEGDPEMDEAMRRALNERHGVARLRWCHYGDASGAFHLLLLHSPEPRSAQQWATALEATGLLPDRLELPRVTKTPLWQTYAKHLADVPGATSCARQLHENIIELGVPPCTPASPAPAATAARPAADPEPDLAADDPVEGARFLLLDPEPAPPPPTLADPLARARSAVLEFLTLPGLGGDAVPGRVAQILARTLSPLQMRPEDREYLSLTRLDREGLGLAQHMPGAPTRQATRLELHRRALALWKLAEACLRRIALAPPEAFRTLDAEARDDLAAAVLCFNEARAAGDAVNIPGLGQDAFLRAGDNLTQLRSGLRVPASSRNRLASVLADLLLVRPAALRCQLPVFDYMSWAFPFVAAIYRLVDAGERSGAAAVAEARRLNAMLGEALQQDAAPLTQYGTRLTAAARRLLSLTTALRVELPPGTGLVPVDAYGAPQRGAAPGLTLPFPSTFEERAQTLPAIMAWHSLSFDLVQFLRDRFDCSMPNLVDAQNLCSNLSTHLMADWHTARLTIHLHPSPSLPDAVYNPSAYQWGPA